MSRRGSRRDLCSRLLPVTYVGLIDDEVRSKAQSLGVKPLPSNFKIKLGAKTVGFVYRGRDGKIPAADVESILVGEGKIPKRFVLSRRERRRLLKAMGRGR